MITPEQKHTLMDLIDAYAVDESMRGLFIGQGSEKNADMQTQICIQRKQQIRTFLDNLTVNQPENQPGN